MVVVQSLRPRPILPVRRSLSMSSRSTTPLPSWHPPCRPGYAFKKPRRPRRCVHTLFIQSHANKCNLHIFQIILSGTPESSPSPVTHPTPPIHVRHVYNVCGVCVRAPAVHVTVYDRGRRGTITVPSITGPRRSTSPPPITDISPPAVLC